MHVNGKLLSAADRLDYLRTHSSCFHKVMGKTICQKQTSIAYSSRNDWWCGKISTIVTGCRCWLPLISLTIESLTNRPAKSVGKETTWSHCCLRANTVDNKLFS
jgi:hypothetical protein